MPTQPSIRCRLAASKPQFNLRSARARSSTPCSRRRPTRTPQANTGRRADPRKPRHIAAGHRTDTPRRTMSTRLSFGVFGRRPCRRVSKTPCQQHHCRRRTRYWPCAAAELVQSPSLIGAQVVRTTFLFHPNLQEAVAFVDGVRFMRSSHRCRHCPPRSELIAIWQTAWRRPWRFWVGFGGTASSRPDWKLRRPPAEGAETVCGSAGAAASEWLFDRPYVTGRPRGAGNVLRPAISINGRIWGLRRWLRGMD